MRKARGRTLGALLSVAVLGASQGSAWAEVRPLTLYQKTARAELVIRCRAQSDSTRRPPMEVLEVFKGVYPGKILNIVPFEQDYANPKPWLKREVFREGQEYVLFLDSYDPDEDAAFQPERPPSQAHDEKAEHLFVLLNADQGMSAVPPEGAGALIDAVKRFVAILALGQHDLQAEALRGLLREKNPYLIEAGLEQVARFDLAVEEDVLPLLAILKSPRDSFRAGAVRLLGALGRAAREAGREMRARDEIFTTATDRAYNDAAAVVRREAVHAVAAIGGEGALAVIRAVAERDPDQDVRYAALVALAEIGGGPRLPSRP